ncbi:flavin reductase family protein [Parenemella sanctibonifatiensis]|uniref:Flavin reductase n=1 Tax=Parenemella sanctibonifatiensis TaxID=2016505 RepID=A0A255DZ26_9ACTN|nr:flavin reductase family protein [Parenemella sanctibonifatiensis]OYN84557.1 flavin reductase [Parenemella sanctibonifatiensis]
MSNTIAAEQIDQAAPVLDLRPVFRQAASSAWVVTATGEAGPVGFTAISVNSVSMDPPIVSFNVSGGSSSLATLGRTRRVAIHLLDRQQEPTARRFAGPRQQRFVDDGSWGYAADGLPCLAGVSARLTADISDLVPAGDSFVVLAEVSAARHAPNSGPLVHHAGSYRA